MKHYYFVESLKEIDLKIDQKTNKVAENISVGKPVFLDILVCNISDKKALISCVFSCGGSVFHGLSELIWGLVEVDGFKESTVNLVNSFDYEERCQKKYYYRCFVVDESQGIDKFIPYLEKLIGEIEYKYTVCLPERISVITNNAEIKALLNELSGSIPTQNIAVS